MPSRYTPHCQKVQCGGVGDASLVRGIDSTDHVFGNPTAKVIIVEYADFDCTYCKTFNETMHQLIANEGATGNVAWVFRHYPLLEIIRMHSRTLEPLNVSPKLQETTCSGSSRLPSSTISRLTQLITAHLRRGRYHGRRFRAVLCKCGRCIVDCPAKNPCRPTERASISARKAHHIQLCL